MAGVFGVGLGTAGVRQLTELADAYQDVTNRILTTTSSVEQLTAVQAALFDVAQQTGVALDSTAKTYQRLEQVIEGSGKSQVEAQTEAIALTKTLNEEIMLSGASQAEASRATQDLVHGLATGTLNMRQFRGVMMQMPDLTKRIADGLGVSQEKLFEMMHTGLSTKDVLAALSNEAGKIDTDFAKLPMTFARAWTVLTNSVEQYVGQASQAGTVSGLLKDAIVGIATHIDTVATGFEAAAVAAGLWLGGKTLQGISGLAVAIKDAALGQGAYASAAAVAAAADAEAAAAKKAALGATIAQIDAQTDLMVAELNQNRAIAAQIMATNGLTEAQLASLPVGERIVELEAQIAAARARVVLAEEAETAATAELAAAQVASSEAAGVFTRAGQGLLAMIGGIPGLVMVAGGALAYMASRTTDLSGVIGQLNQEAEKQKASTISLTQALSALASGEVAHTQTLEELTQSRRADAQAELDQLNSARQHSLILRALPALQIINIVQTLKLKSALEELD